MEPVICVTIPSASPTPVMSGYTLVLHFVAVVPLGKVSGSHFAVRLLEELEALNDIDKLQTAGLASSRNNSFYSRLIHIS
jgi:hypothetical protein